MKLILGSFSLSLASLLLLPPVSSFGSDTSSNQGWKAAQSDYVTCSASKSDELLNTQGSATEIAEISTAYCSTILDAYKQRFAAYLLSQMTGSTAMEMADSGAERGAQVTVNQTKAFIAERVLIQRAKIRSTTDSQK